MTFAMNSSGTAPRFLMRSNVDFHFFNVSRVKRVAFMSSFLVLFAALVVFAGGSLLAFVIEILKRVVLLFHNILDFLLSDSLGFLDTLVEHEDLVFFRFILVELLSEQ